MQRSQRGIKSQEKNNYFQNRSHLQYKAVMTLNLLLDGASYKGFAVDVCYHKKCNYKFALSHFAIETQASGPGKHFHR